MMNDFTQDGEVCWGFGGVLQGRAAVRREEGLVSGPCLRVGPTPPLRGGGGFSKVVGWVGLGGVRKWVQPTHPGGG